MRLTTDAPKNNIGVPRTVLEFGKTVFLTREEAEKALEAGKDETS